MGIYDDAKQIIDTAIAAVLPDAAVKKAIQGREFGEGRLVLIAVGKAAWQMAYTANELLGGRIDDGAVITKYGHAKGPLKGLRIFEAGHPISDRNSFSAAEEAIRLVSGLGASDTVLFLLSGGGSALFEKPLIPAAELESLTNQLLACGAGIVEINTVRKRLSAVKGGRFAELCAPARVFSVILSDIIGNPLDMIASGPTSPDSSTCEQALAITEKYKLSLSDAARELLARETPKTLDNAEAYVTGSVGEFAASAAKACRRLGYETTVLTDSLCCTARDAGSFLASIARYHSQSERSLAFIAAGETVVKLTGSGRGGRNQEIALSAALGIDGLSDTAVFSVGSDGTDGPTDAAGGYCDGKTRGGLLEQGVDIETVLQDNASYDALEKCGGLIKTGPTGTNVNDISVVLIRRNSPAVNGNI
ncbi:MAG TPA: glycerate kinase [Anaerovoracaceae bacterium]|nr:glycerate kinase [Anaerovoracaceae bacterium]